MSNLNLVPESVAELVRQLGDRNIPVDKRQNFRKTLEDIRLAAGQAIVRFDAECLAITNIQAKKKKNK